MHVYADRLTTELVWVRSQEDEDLLYTLEKSNLTMNSFLPDPAQEEKSCKAELIDIGIPRRDSIEAIELWHHTREHITRDVNQLPIPGHLYFVDEYVVMIREALGGVSPAPRKACKRIRRLYDVLRIDNAVDPHLDDVVAEARQEVEGPVLPLALAALDQIAQQYVTRLIPILLRQFMDGYDLRIEAGLAPVVDQSFQNWANPAYNPAIAADVQAGINGDASWNNGTHGLVLRWVAVARDLSDMLEQNLKDRAAFFGFGPQANAAETNRRRILETFVKAFYTATVFSQENDLEVQLAVCGSFAAHLHAGQAQTDAEWKATKRELDPVARIELKIYCCAYLFWPNEETMGHLHYHPLIVRISVATNFWPQQLGFIRGFPVLSVRDLIRECNHKAALAREWGRAQRLKTTAEVLKELLTRFDY